MKDAEGHDPCSNPEPHPAHEWVGGDYEAWCPGIPEPDEVAPTGMAALMAWLTEDYECNGVEIVMQCTGADYEDDDDKGESPTWGYAYEIKLIEVGMYPGLPPSSTGDSGWTTYQHTGYGFTMDEAADNALAVRAEHKRDVLHEDQ